MKIAIEQVRVSCAVGEVRVPTPAPVVARREWWALNLRGVVDRLRYRGVADVERPFTVHEIEEQCRHWENRGVVLVEALMSTLQRESARLTDDAVPEERVEVPVRDELVGLTGRKRLEWADRVRAARAHNAAVASQEARSAANADRRRLLEADVRRLGVESRQLRAEWEKGYAQRVAIYTRARHGLLGRRPSSSPSIPEYRHSRGLTPAPGAADADAGGDEPDLLRLFDDGEAA